MSKDKDKVIYTAFCAWPECKAKTTESGKIFGWGWIGGKHYCPTHQDKVIKKPKEDKKKKP